MSVNDGGPVHPCDSLSEKTGRVIDQHFGMSVLDHFAGLAFAQLLAPKDEIYEAKVDEYLAAVADYSYRAARAMLAARD